MMKKLGILGLGHMGSAILEGALGTIGKDQLMVYDPLKEKTDAAKARGIDAAKDEKELCRSCHMILFAIRPQDVAQVLENMKGSAPECLLTIAAGVPIHRFTDVFEGLSVIRAMPNTPLQIGCGAVALCRNEACSDEDYAFAKQLFSKLGAVADIDESHMCDIIAVNGSTPAYFYYYIECMLEDAVNRGIKEEDARTLLVETMIGSGLLLRNNPEKPISTFVDEVCSKGGTTIEAINIFKASDFREIVEKADSACIRRAEELGK